MELFIKVFVATIVIALAATCVLSCGLTAYEWIKEQLKR